eukprot:5383696-Ditylum_brightwellii.AAC.1
MKDTWVCLMEILRLLYHSLRMEIRKYLKEEAGYNGNNIPFLAVFRPVRVAHESWSEAFGVWRRRRIDSGGVVSHGETAEAL